MDYYIVNLSHHRKNAEYITFWRPEDKGYAFPLSCAGRYDQGIVLEHLDYYNCGSAAVAVPCDVVDPLGVTPTPRTIDNNAGPVLRNTKENWVAILSNLIQRPDDRPEPEWPGSRKPAVKKLVSDLIRGLPKTFPAPMQDEGMPKMPSSFDDRYTIKVEDSGTVLANGINLLGVLSWWKENENRFVGVTNEDFVITVRAQQSQSPELEPSEPEGAPLRERG